MCVEGEKNFGRLLYPAFSPEAAVGGAVCAASGAVGSVRLKTERRCWCLSALCLMFMRQLYRGGNGLNLLFLELLESPPRCFDILLRRGFFLLVCGVGADRLLQVDAERWHGRLFVLYFVRTENTCLRSFLRDEGHTFISLLILAMTDTRLVEEVTLNPFYFLFFAA